MTFPPINYKPDVVSVHFLWTKAVFCQPVIPPAYFIRQKHWQKHRTGVTSGETVIYRVKQITINFRFVTVWVWNIWKRKYFHYLYFIIYKYIPRELRSDIYATVFLNIKCVISFPVTLFHNKTGYFCIFVWLLESNCLDLCPFMGGYSSFPLPPTPLPHSQSFYQTTLPWTFDLQITLKTHLWVRMRREKGVMGGRSSPLCHQSFCLPPHQPIACWGYLISCHIKVQRQRGWRHMMEKRYSDINDFF